MRNVPGTSSAYAERVIGGYFLDITPDREALGRYGLMVGDVQDVIATALGGQSVTNTVEGRERYTVNVRYPRGLPVRPAGHRRRGAGAAPGRGHGAAARGRQGRAHPRARPRSAPRTASSRSTSSSTSAGATSAATSPRRARPWPTRSSCRQGTTLQWSGQYEYLERAEARLKVVVPLTLLVVFLLLFLNFRRLTETLIVMLSLPFALVGGIWLMWWMGFNMSVAVAVGFIALAGVAAETGVIMLVYLDHALDEVRAACAREGRPLTREDLRRAIMVGAVERVRPKMMTVTAIMAGLHPDPVEHGRRLRGDAAHRRADDRRHGVLDRADPGGDPGRLRAGEGMGPALGLRDAGERTPTAEPPAYREAAE